MNIQNLRLLSTFSIKKLAEASGIPIGRLRTKIHRGTELRVDESEKLEKVLKEQFKIEVLR